MANRWLKGNGHWCPTCSGSGRGKLSSTVIYEGGVTVDLYDRCQACGGARRIAATPEQIARETIRDRAPLSA